MLPAAVPLSAAAAGEPVATFPVATAALAANFQDVDVAVGDDGVMVFIRAEFGNKLGSRNRIVTRPFSHDRREGRTSGHA